MSLKVGKKREQAGAVRAIAAAILFWTGFVAGEHGELRTFAAGRGLQQEHVARRPTPGIAEGNRVKAPGSVPEGIKVHGHWTIEVHNPDGSFVTRREFENALADGALLLGPILGRGYTNGGWAMWIYGPCTAVLNGCGVVESTDPFYSGNSIFKSLIVSGPLPNAPGAGTLTLSGTFSPQIAGQITVVKTSLETCQPTVGPANCPSVANNIGYFFSQAQITPLPVIVGQVVQVTVVFSFS